MFVANYRSRCHGNGNLFAVSKSYKWLQLPLCHGLLWACCIHAVVCFGTAVCTLWFKSQTLQLHIYRISVLIIWEAPVVKGYFSTYSWRAPDCSASNSLLGLICCEAVQGNSLVWICAENRMCLRYLSVTRSGYDAAWLMLPLVSCWCATCCWLVRGLCWRVMKPWWSLYLNGMSKLNDGPLTYSTVSLQTFHSLAKCTDVSSVALTSNHNSVTWRSCLVTFAAAQKY